MLRIYNTVTKRKEEFKPVKKGEVGIYVCGPTVYDHSHIGHARTYLAFDIMVRYLEHRGYKVKYVQNITDVDDKMVARANREGISVAELAETFTRSYYEDMEALKVRPPDVQPRATGHILEMSELIQKLIDRGKAYVVDGDVYYDVNKFEGYGSLSGQTIERLRAGARVEPGEKKRNPLDFALWKSAKTGEPSWNSPWGPGRPGWHIECSAMSMKYLGETFDIHGGGSDLLFPHHENERAQSEGATGKPLARYWIHTGFLNIRGEKMSKSLGNIIPIKEALKRHGAETLRLFFLSTHYRSPVDYSEEALEQAEKSLEGLYETLDRVKRSLKQPGGRSDEEGDFVKKLRRLKTRFEEALDDDFNTPMALSAVYELSGEVNKFLEEPRSRETLEKILGFFGDVSKIFGVLEEERRVEADVEAMIKLIIEVRRKLRERKDYELSDLIRGELSKLGVELQDIGDETIYKIKPKPSGR